MNILVISKGLNAGDLAYSLTKTGHNVKLHVDGEHCRHNLREMVAKTVNWRKELDWVGKNGLIVFDDAGYGRMQDQLRRKGFKVFGGGSIGDALSRDQAYAMATFAEHGLKVKKVHSFAGVNGVVKFARRHPGAWVLRGGGTEGVLYVGMFDDGRDLMDVLADLKKNGAKGPFTLQQKVSGEEISVSGLFNGSDWVGPPLLSVEHRDLMPGEVGPSAGDMGSLGWYEHAEERQTGLFAQTLGKLRPFLQASDYRGAVRLTCIVNDEGAFPVRIDCHAASSVLHLQSELNVSPWAELLLAVASGEAYDLSYKNGTAVAVVIAVPPFPSNRRRVSASAGTARIYFADAAGEQLKSHVHFENVSYDKARKTYYVSEGGRHALYVTESGPTVEEAAAKAYRIVQKVVIPQMMYRDDIGERFAATSRKRLRKWGFIY